MQEDPDVRVVMVTAPDLETARRLARGLLQARLIACANLIPQVESHYHWDDQCQCDAEVLLLLKSAVENLPSLEAYVLKEHPYDTCEILALPIHSGTPAYLDWIRDSVRKTSLDPGSREP